MVKSLSSKTKLVVDSCFWINVVYLNLEKYLLEFFELYFVSKVEDEILNKQNIILYETNDMKLFNQLKQKKLINIVDAKNIPKVLLDNLQSGSGELYSVAYSIENNILLATDNNGPIAFCKIKKIPIMTSVDFIIYLYKSKKLNKKQCFELFDKLNKNIKNEIIKIGMNYFK